MLSKQVAKDLAGVFSMLFFDQMDLFSFDNIPYSFAEIYQMNGEEYVKEKLKNVVKMELEFDNAVFVCDLSFVDNCLDLFYKIKLYNFVILLKKDSKIEADELKRKRYGSQEESLFFCVSENVLKKREMAVSSDIADVVVDIDGLDQKQIIEQIASQIQEYYSIN